MNWKEKLKPSKLKIVITIFFLILFIIIVNINLVESMGVRFYMPGSNLAKGISYERFIHILPGLHFWKGSSCGDNVFCRDSDSSYIAINYISLITLIIILVFYLLSDSISKKISKFRKKSD